MDDEAKQKARALGARLRDYRAIAGLGVNQLAEYSGVSAGYISRLERGLVPRPSAPTLQKLAAKLNVTLPMLMGTERTSDEAQRDLDVLVRLVQQAQFSPEEEASIKEMMRFALHRHQERMSEESKTYVNTDEGGADSGNLQPEQERPGAESGQGSAREMVRCP